MAFSDPQVNIDQLGLREGDLVADLGAGTGAYTIAAARVVGDSGRVYAVEVQKELLKNVKEAAARERLGNVEVIWGDIERAGKTKIRDNIIDAVVVANVLFQVEDRTGFLGEIKRILKSKGKVLAVDWEESFGGMGPQSEDVISHDRARTLFEDAGFSFIKNINAGDHHWGFLLEK